ncbi:MAG: STAS domain-containing protein [Planctomycetota bacterium]|jgi:anti-anti-sigma factor
MPDMDKPFVVLRSESGIDVVLVQGEIDRHVGVPRLEMTLAPIKRRKAAKVIVDFRDVSYCCSTGIALLLDVSETVKESGGTLVLAAVAGAAREPMEILDIPDIVRFFDSTAEALEELERGSLSAASLN